MEGFDDALDGYYDPQDQLSRYFFSRADDYSRDGRVETPAIDSRRGFERRRETVREAFLSGVGGLPERRGDPPVETTGRTELEGYAVETLSVETLPQFHATANCYVPDGEGPHPGILFLCGHLDDPRVDPENQRACIELAENGFVVLVVDPVCQGERRQYFDGETGDPVFDGSGGVFPHCFAGQKCFYAGANLARFLVHDARRALDYLVGRPDVDASRVGVTGTSGGGLQTQYLALVDDRMAAAAPCCSVRDRRDFLRTGKRFDAEQVVYDAFPRGIDADDFLAAMAPDPILVGAATSDQYFPIESVHEVVERVRRAYDHYDAAEKVHLAVADAPHCSVYEFGLDVFEFFCDGLGDDDYDPVDDYRILDADELRVTPEGSVVHSYPDERTVDDLIRDYVAETASSAGTDVAPRGRDHGGDPGDYRRRLVETFDLDREGCNLHPRFVDRTDEDGLTVERVWFRTERDPDAVVAGVLVSDPGSTADAPAVVLYEEGTDALPERGDDVADLAREYGAAFLFDPRGVGAVRNRTIPIPAWVEGYYRVYGTEFKLAYDALEMGTSLLALRVYDVLRSVEFLRAETGADRVSFVGEGVGGYHALYAAVAAEDVDGVLVREVDDSFYDRATSTEIHFEPRLTVFDVVGQFDVPHLRTALERRGVTLVFDGLQ